MPLYYENRATPLKLINPSLTDDIYRIVEKAFLDEDQEKKLEREVGREYHLITRDNRLEDVARNIVTHFTNHGFFTPLEAVRLYRRTLFEKMCNAHKTLLLNAIMIFYIGICI